jgi:hypothetical protein
VMTPSRLPAANSRSFSIARHFSDSPDFQTFTLLHFRLASKS